MMTPAQKARQALTAKVHIARKQLALNESTYRAMIERITNDRTDSSAGMTIPELEAFVAELTRKGWKPAPPQERQDDWITIDPNSPAAKHHRKLLACAFALERSGAVRSNRTGVWLQKFTKKITGIDRLQWLDAANTNRVIEALKGWKRKWEAKHPSEAAQLAGHAAIPAGVRVKAATFDAMRLVSEAGSPAEGIRNVLVLLDSQNFSDAQIAAQVAELVREFGERARQALVRWDFKKVRSELLWLVGRVHEIDPSIAEGMRDALKAGDSESETPGAVRGPRKNNLER